MIVKLIEHIADAAAERAVARMREEQRRITPELEQLLSKSDLARSLGVSVATVDRLIQQGLPFTQIGGGKRFKSSDAMAWLAQRQQTKAQPPKEPDPPFGDPELRGVRLLSRRRRS